MTTATLPKMPRLNKKYKCRYKPPQETYEQYVERCAESNVDPLPKIKWETMVVNPTARLEIADLMWAARLLLKG